MTCYEFIPVEGCTQSTIKAVARGLAQGLVHRQEGVVESIEEQTRQLDCSPSHVADVT